MIQKRTTPTIDNMNVVDIVEDDIYGIHAEKDMMVTIINVLNKDHLAELDALSSTMVVFLGHSLLADNLNHKDVSRSKTENCKLSGFSQLAIFYDN